MNYFSIGRHLIHGSIDAMQQEVYVLVGLSLTRSADLLARISGAEKSCG